jgi:hypothetical protein
VINFGVNKPRKPGVFRFEKWWLNNTDFKEVVHKAWNTECIFSDPIEIWQFKIRTLRKKLKGWAKNMNAEIRKAKSEFLKEFEVLDMKYEDKVTVDENKMLEASFTEEEIKTDIYESYVEGAPGPDDFSFLFYHHFWDLIKTDFMNLVKDFESGHLNLDRLNYAVITLIPKRSQRLDF